MSMPKATVDHNHGAQLRQRHVRLARECPHVYSETVSCKMQSPPNPHLRRRVLRADRSHHAAASLNIDSIGHSK